LEALVIEEASTAVETAAIAKILACRDPRDETTALRKTATAGPASAHVTSTNSRDARIGCHNRDSTSTAERNTGTAGLKASQEAAGTSGNANNSKGAKLVEMQC
jgi:hypothetical protein